MINDEMMNVSHLGCVVLNYILRSLSRIIEPTRESLIAPSSPLVKDPSSHSASTSFSACQPRARHRQGQYWAGRGREIYLEHMGGDSNNNNKITNNNKTRTAEQNRGWFPKNGIRWPFGSQILDCVFMDAGLYHDLIGIL